MKQFNNSTGTQANIVVMDNDILYRFSDCYSSNKLVSRMRKKLRNLFNFKPEINLKNKTFITCKKFYILAKLNIRFANCRMHSYLCLHKHRN